MASIIAKGWWSYDPLVYVFGIVPLLEVFVKPDETNSDEQNGFIYN